jgi:hypothetical protein
MKKLLLSLMAVAIAIVAMSTAAFAATGPQPSDGLLVEYGSDKLLSFPAEVELESFTDAKTGLSFSYPESWSLSVSNKYWRTTTGKRIKQRAVELYDMKTSSTLRFTQLNYANKSPEDIRFLVTDNNNGIYYVSTQQSPVCIQLPNEYNNEEPKSFSQNDMVGAIVNSIKFVSQKLPPAPMGN